MVNQGCAIPYRASPLSCQHRSELAARKDMQDLLPRAVLLSRFLVHEAALGIARAARYSERQAHRLADMVSHKRGFERRETRSEFLRKVSEGREETRE